MALRVKIWGCRGSIATPASTHMKYGGNTTSLEVDVGDRKILLDCGTGIRNLGRELVKSDLTRCAILLTHTHWDHINGFPFFTPAFNPAMTFDIMAGHLNDKGGIKSVFAAQMENPMFPVPLDAMQATLNFSDFAAGESWYIDDAKEIKVSSCLLNHPNDATGYRVDYQGSSMCLITDTEHVQGTHDENILRLIDGADLVIYDSTYTEKEFPNHVGWGHSTWEEGLTLCQEAGAKQLGIFHHDPEHDDDFMDALADEAEKAWDGCFVIREGMDLTLG